MIQYARSSYDYNNVYILGPVALSKTSPTADPGVASLIPTGSHTFVEIDHEIISSVIHTPLSTDSRFVVSYKQKNVTVST